MLGDLPLVGHVFRNETLNGVSNELIITVTPHVVVPGTPDGLYPGAPLQAVPTPQALPTLAPGTLLPTPPSIVSHLAIPAVQHLPAPPTPFPPLLAHRLPAPVAVPTPAPMPSVFAQTNVFTFGSPPQNNYAGSSDGVQIFYASLSPTVLSYGTPVTVTAITSTNVTALTLSYNGVQTSVLQTGAGQWSATFPFTLIGLPEPNGNIQLTLTASKNDGTAAIIPIPVSVVPRTASARGDKNRR